MNRNKTWCVSTLALLILILAVTAAMTGIIDPFFHYHAPLEGLQYPLNNQRYQNNGIVRSFSYDALITGTSLAENFKTSEFDALFGVHAIKVPFSGGTYEEIYTNLLQALESNSDLKTVLIAIDEWFLFSGRNLILADGEYPTYLYDDNLLNDVKYLLNKEIFCDNTLGVLDYTRSGQDTTSFDDYSSWEGIFPYDAENVISNYARPPKAEVPSEFTRELADRLTDTLQNTIIKTAKEHPDVQFLIFFPPYSILNWDNHNQLGTLERQVQAFALASRLMLGVDNLQLYAFYDDYTTVTDLSQYRDIVHYCGAVNSLILQRIHMGEYRLTREKNDTYWQEILDYYQSYDYDALFS